MLGIQALLEQLLDSLGAYFLGARSALEADGLLRGIVERQAPSVLPNGLRRDAYFSCDLFNTTCTQTRTAGFGARRADFMRHAALQSDELVLIGLVESPQGVANAAAILAVEPGLDAISVGCSDLVSAIVIYRAAEVGSWADAGCSIFIVPSESTLLHEVAQRWSTDVRGS